MSASTQPATEQGTGGAAGHWQIDPAHSLVEFSAKHMMFTTIKGRFGNVKGEIDFDQNDISRSRATVEIDAASIDTRTEQRDNHLRSADFLDAEHYPALTFQSTRVERVDEERFNLVGNLTIRGTTREVTLETTFNGTGKNPFGKTVAGFTAETKLNRKEFGLNWNVALETGGWLVGDTIKITIEVQAVQL